MATQGCQPSCECSACADFILAGCRLSKAQYHLFLCSYDDGCTNITNVDFSTLVIKEMMALHLKQRPKMRWMVQDMTATKVGSYTVRDGFLGALQPFSGSCKGPYR